MLPASAILTWFIVGSICASCNTQMC